VSDQYSDEAPLPDEQLQPVRPSRGALIGASLVTVLAVGFLVLQGGGGGGGSGDSGSASYDTEVYFTREGDTFDTISTVLDVEAEALADANGLSTSDALTVGTELTVPDDPSSTATTPAVSESPDPEGVVDDIEKWSDRYGVPAALMKALAWQESSWDQSRVSSAGAVGVTQLEPDTATYVATDLLDEPTLSVENQDDNIQMGTRYLAYLLELNNGDWGAALASYNEGPTTIRRNGWSEAGTQYVTSVMALTRGFQAAEP
jgi:soluble lytic murein transglycosylase-like protein